MARLAYTIRVARSASGWRPRPSSRRQRYLVRLESTTNGRVLLTSELYRDRADARAIAAGLFRALEPTAEVTVLEDDRRVWEANDGTLDWTA